jgi:uncharacterized protein
LKETALEIVSRVMDLYAQIDKAVAEFQLKSGLRCPTACGACCPTANVEATVLEMLPLAHEILCKGRAVEWLERLSAHKEPDRCILFSKLPLPDGPGHCSVYTWRPVLCRLFGFSAVRGRTGDKTLSVCRQIKHMDPQGATAAMALADQAPCFVHYSTQVYALDPVLGARLMPINTALRHAVERLGLRLSFVYGETLRNNTAA